MTKLVDNNHEEIMELIKDKMIQTNNDTEKN